MENIFDFKYLSVKELESLLSGTRDELEADRRTRHPNPFLDNKIKENERLADLIEAEILERTLLGAKTNGGCSD